MATISNGSVTITLAAGDTYRFKASGEAYVDIGGGSSESYRLIGATSEKIIGNFAQATPVTIRVVTGSVEYSQNPVINGNAQTGSGNIYDEDGKIIRIGQYPEYIGPIGIRSAYPDTFATGNVTKYMKGQTVDYPNVSGNFLRVDWASIIGFGTDENAMLTGTFTAKCWVKQGANVAWLSYNGDATGATGVGQMSDYIQGDETVLPFTYQEGVKIIIGYEIAFFPTANNRYPYYQDGLNVGGFDPDEFCIISQTPMAPIQLGVTPTTVGGGTISTAFSYRPFAIFGKTTKETGFDDGDSLDRGKTNFNVNTLSDRYGVNGLRPRFLAKAGISFVNVSFSGDDLFTASQPGKFAKRGKYMQWCTFYLGTKGTNDFGVSNTPTVSTMNGYWALVKAQLTGGEGKPFFLAPLLSRSSASPFTTLAAAISYITNQVTQGNYAAVKAWNTAIRTGLAICDGFIETGFLDTFFNSGITQYPPSSKTITDANITSGTNVLNSATAKFSIALNDLFIRLPTAGPAAGPLIARILYVSQTQIQLKSSSGTNINADTTVTDGLAYIDYLGWQYDGLHFEPLGADEWAKRAVSAGEHRKITG